MILARKKIYGLDKGATEGHLRNMAANNRTYSSNLRLALSVFSLEYELRIEQHRGIFEVYFTKKLLLPDTVASYLGEIHLNDEYVELIVKSKPFSPPEPVIIGVAGVAILAATIFIYKQLILAVVPVLFAYFMTRRTQRQFLKVLEHLVFQEDDDQAYRWG